MKMKKLSALILCFTMLLSMSFSAEVYAHEEDIMRTENYQKTKAFVDSGDIYDLGLYSMEDAVRIIGRQDPDFADLCGEPQTVASLAVLISQEDDEFLKNLMVFWYNYLLIQHGFPVTYSNTSDYVSYTLTLPGGKTIDAFLYTGNSTPDTYANASSYTSAILLSLSSYRYNCHSYAWYLHGDINSQSPQLCFDDHCGFTHATPSCATQVYSPQVGDIVTYTDPEDFDSLRAKHSAIITSVSAGTGVNQIVVASKWGYYGVYSHILSDCPYYTDAEHGTTHYLTNVKYYRLSHQYILSGNYYYCKCCGYKNPTMVVSGVTK